MLLVFALVQALAAAEPSAPPSTGEAARYEACLAQIETDPNGAYENAMAWAHLTNARAAKRCAALALIERGRPDEAGRRFDIMALSGTESDRANDLSAAGNAWLLARNPDRALKSFNNALRTVQATPDLLIDRARAFAMLREWNKAENDLNAALDLDPKNALALRLRAEARMRQKAFDLAVKDAEDAVALSPGDIEALLTRGRAIDARRKGQAPDE
jgi:tetratricopeptide (TPR) repeat protein